ncbi:transmembrane protein 17A-like [Ornithodoros turicata]|uniref:transmembrane protein 17A-like n=1 Tax=Ornithodoros turicata TaxID=34597 RepID=UPI0031395132
MSSVGKLVESVTESLFPGVLQNQKNKPSLRPFRFDDEILTNLPLQMLIFFNSCYSPLWVIARVLALYLKYRYLDETYQVLCSAILLMMTLVEAPRLYLGHLGNLTEEMPALAGFWLLTTILQLPLLLWLACGTPLALPIERAIDVPQFVILPVEVMLGFFVVRKITRHQRKQFLERVKSNTHTE